MTSHLAILNLQTKLSGRELLTSQLRCAVHNHGAPSQCAHARSSWRTLHLISGALCILFLFHVPSFLLSQLPLQLSHQLIQPAFDLACQSGQPLIVILLLDLPFSCTWQCLSWKWGIISCDVANRDCRLELLPSECHLMLEVSLYQESDTAIRWSEQLALSWHLQTFVQGC